MIMDEAQVRQLEDQRYAAMLAGNVATLERLLDDDLTYTHSNGVVDNKVSYIAGIRDRLWEYKAIAREGERVVIRGTCALVFCRLRIDLLVRGTPRHVDSHALAVWASGGAPPRLLSVHSTPAAG